MSGKRAGVDFTSLVIYSGEMCPCRRAGLYLTSVVTYSGEMCPCRRTGLDLTSVVKLAAHCEDFEQLSVGNWLATFSVHD